MGFLSAIPIVGDIVKGIFGLIDKSTLDKDKAADLKHNLQVLFENSDLTKFVEDIRAKTSVILAETKGESWLQRNWRPGLMSLFGIIIFNNYVLNPWLSALLSIDIMMEIPPDMWALLKLGMGGYVVGRSVEKGIKVWRDKGGK